MKQEDISFEKATLRKLGDSVEKHFYVKLVGVSHANSDGSSRREVIRNLAEREELRLVPEPNNEFDPNAILVCTQDGTGAGYLDRRLAGEVTRSRRRGVHWRAYVRKVLHEPRTRHWGVVVCMVGCRKEPDGGTSQPGWSGSEFLAKHYPDYKRVTTPTAPRQSGLGASVAAIIALVILVGLILRGC